jgi:hypothetical protein
MPKLLKFENVIRGFGALGIAGGILAWVIFIGASGCADCQNSAAYQTYETWNRLFPIPLLMMALAVIGLYGRQQAALRWFGRLSMGLLMLGLLLMIAGSIAEFWFFTDQDYGEPGNGRGISFGIFLLGLLVVMGGSVLTGIATWRAGILPEWSAIAIGFFAFGIGSVLMGIALVSETFIEEKAS